MVNSYLLKTLLGKTTKKKQLTVSGETVKQLEQKRLRFIKKDIEDAERVFEAGVSEEGINIQ